MVTPLQVLIVEDRAADAELMAKELQRAGFNVDWQRVDNERDFRMRLTPGLDLILSDYNVPGFGANPAMEAVRESKLDVPLIIVSGSIGDDRAAECLKMGATDYILKDRMARLGPAVGRALKDRKMRQEKLRAEAALRISEEQMRGILSTVEDMVFSMSLPDYKLRYMNPAGAKLFGRPVEDFMADSSLWLQSIHAEDRAGVIADQLSALRWGTSENRFRMVTAKGSIRHVASRVWAAYDGDGKPSRLEGIITDVTERLQAEEEKRQLEQSRLEQERLGKISEFKSQFLNMVAHDLNNIVTPMRLSLRMIKDAAKAGSVEKLSQPVATLDRSVERIATFLADLLDTARLQSGALKITPMPIDLSAALAATIDSVKDQANARKIGLQSEVPAGINVNADARRIEQVTTNLLSNALKFTPEGGTIRIGLAQSKDEVRVDVADTGPGIKPEDIPKLFQPFSQVGTAVQGKHTGTGLGLFICKGLVEAHGGRIWCESKEGQGSLFSFTLPLSTRARAGSR